MSLLKTPQAQKLVHEHIKQQIVSGNSEAYKYAPALPVETLATLPVETLATLPAETLAALPVMVNAESVEFFTDISETLEIKESDILSHVNAKIPSGSVLTLTVDPMFTKTVLSSSGDTVYTITPAHAGKISVTYTATVNAYSSTASMNIIVPPTAQNDSFSGLIMGDDEYFLDALSNDTEIDPSTEPVLETPPTNGMVVFDSTLRQFKYTPTDPSNPKADSFVYRDDVHSKKAATVTFDFKLPTVDAKEASYSNITEDTDFTTRINWGTDVQLSTFVKGFKKPLHKIKLVDGSHYVDKLTFSEGTIELEAGNNEGHFTFHPATNYYGPVATFKYIVLDNSDAPVSLAGEVKMNIKEVDDKPEIFTLQTISVTQGSKYNLNDKFIDAATSTRLQDADGHDIFVKPNSCKVLSGTSIGSITGTELSASATNSGTTTFECTLIDSKGNVADKPTPFEVTVNPTAGEKPVVTMDMVKKLQAAQVYIDMNEASVTDKVGILTDDPANIKKKVDKMTGFGAKLKTLLPKKDIECFNDRSAAKDFCENTATGKNKYTPTNADTFVSAPSKPAPTMTVAATTVGLFDAKNLVCKVMSDNGITLFSDLKSGLNSAPVCGGHVPQSECDLILNSSTLWGLAAEC